MDPILLNETGLMPLDQAVPVNDTNSAIVAIANSYLIPLTAVALSARVPATPFKYMYSSYIMEQCSSYFNDNSLSVNELDNYLYHSVLLFLFKGMFGQTPVNNEYLLSVFTIPYVRKLIIDSDWFQSAKKTIALDLFLLLAKEGKGAIVTEVFFRLVKSHVGDAPLKIVLDVIAKSQTPAHALLILKDTLDRLSKHKKNEASLLVDDMASQIQRISQGEIECEKLILLINDGHKLIKELDMESSKSVSLFSQKGLSNSVGKIALSSIAPSLAICTNISDYSPISELAFRTSGALYALFCPGITPVFMTEVAVHFIAKPFAKRMNDYGEPILDLKKEFRNIHEGFCDEIKLMEGCKLNQIYKMETLLFQTVASSAILMMAPLCHPAIHTFTTTHMVQHLETHTSFVRPSKKINFFDAMSVQIPIALALTTLHATVFPGNGGRVFLNAAALTLTHPFMMNKVMEMELIEALNSFIRSKVPGSKEMSEFALAENVVDAVAPFAASKKPLFAYAPIGLRVVKAGRVIKSVVDQLGGIETITIKSKQVATNALILYGNYVTFGTTATVLGPEIGVLVTGIGIGKGLSKTTIGTSVVAAGLVYLYTQSAALTSLTVTAVHAISGSVFLNQTRTLVGNFFSRWF